jgi:alpha-glucosidase
MEGEADSPLHLRGCQLEAGGLHLDLGSGVARLSVGDDGSLRLRAGAGRRLAEDPGPALGREPWATVALEPVRHAESALAFSHEGPGGESRVEVTAEPFSMTVLDGAGHQVARLFALGLEPSGAASICVEAHPDERFFGFGEKPGGLDKRGEHLQMRNRDPNLLMRDPLYVSIPFYLSLRYGTGSHRARGILLDAYAPSRFDVAATHAERVRMETGSGGLDVSIFPGPTPAEVLRRFTARVGRTPLPPRWALGYHQSRWSYASRSEVLALARELRTRGIPSDAIHLDIDHMDGFQVFTWHPQRFPDPKELVRELALLGFRLVTIVDPGVKVDPGYEVYRDGLERDVFCRSADGEGYSLAVWPGRAALPDFNREDVRHWWGEQHRQLCDAGVAGIWNDMNEPAGWDRDVRFRRVILPWRQQDLSNVLQADPAQPEQRVPHEQVRNLYGYQECRATRAFLEAERPEQRPFVLTRSGWTGIQRHAAVWTGDNHSRWSHLRESIPMLLNLSLSGVAHCGADIGGFALSCTPELFARWIQLGSLYPFARGHSMWLSRRQEPWRFGRRVETIAREALALRMRLLPYLYGLFRQAEEHGAPVWRPLFYEFPDDPVSATVQDEFMLGPDLLVAPVVERGARERAVYLPPGRWMAWHDDALYAGPRTVEVTAPLERLPIFAACGALVPTRSAVEHADAVPDEPFVLEVFPGADGRAELVEDDGETLAYRRGALARTSLRLWHRAGGRLRLEIACREGDYAIDPRRARIRVRGCPEPDRVRLDARSLSAGGAPGFRAHGGRVDIHFEERGEGHTLEIEPAP